MRAIWSDEARDFTPWLADHLEELGKALHLDMHLVEAEGAIGPFAADIIADGENGLVVIENQLERSDHGHLGQLLTYAAGRDARTLIWIAPELRDEHRAAINWLNRWTQRKSPSTALLCALCESKTRCLLQCSFRSPLLEAPGQSGQSGEIQIKERLRALVTGVHCSRPRWLRID